MSLPHLRRRRQHQVGRLWSSTGHSAARLRVAHRLAFTATSVPLIAIRTCQLLVSSTTGTFEATAASLSYLFATVRTQRQPVAQCASLASDCFCQKQAIWAALTKS